VKPTFFDALEARAKEVGSLLCIGLDPHPEDLSAQNAPAALAYCQRIIEETADIVLAYKPNAAFFELYGAEGVAALQALIKSIPENMPVILDAKRGDIGSTSEAYAQASFYTIGADCVTVNPYLGQDAVAPFLHDPGKGVFLLCKTSNPGSGDLQDLKLVPSASDPAPKQMRVFEWVAQLAQKWNVHGNLGLVVGATFPDELRAVRKIAPELWILAPGIGAQGGDISQVVQAGLRTDGLGLLINVSRGIARAPDPRQAALEIHAEIQHAVTSFSVDTPNLSAEHTYQLSPNLAFVANELLSIGCVKFGEFTLKSGLHSPIYIDLRRLVGFPDILERVAKLYLPLIEKLTFDRLGALPYAALPITSLISLLGGWPMIYPRKEKKEYGTRADIEGVFHPGEKVLVIDDLVTTGGSKFEAIDKFTAAGLSVSDVVVLIDRESGALADLAEAGYHLHAVYKMSGLLDYWQSSGSVPTEDISAARRFLRQNH
jgi:uridine monophosphate synthetase